MMQARPAYKSAVASYVSVPTSYSRVAHSYAVPYSRQQAFVAPVGLPPHLVAKMMQASEIFRTFDTDYSGRLSKKEWKRAMWALGYYMSKHDAKQLFYRIDRDGSGKVDEREFCEFWIQQSGF